MTFALRSSHPRSGAALIAAVAGASVAALGGLVVAGWLTLAVALIQVLPGFPPMQYNTALGFMICGAALLAAVLELRRPAALLGGLAAALGGATLSQYLLGIDLGIDGLLVETYLFTGVSNPGRMSPNSALALALVGAALLCLSRRRSTRARHLYPALLGSVVIALGTAALVGYVAGVPGAYGWGHYHPIAIHSALGYILLGGGIVGLAWNAAKAESSEAPDWLPLLAAVAVATLTLCMWYALGYAPGAKLPNSRPPATALPNITLAAGLLSALLLAWSVRTGQIARRHARSLETANRAMTEEIQARAGMEETVRQMAAIVESSDDAIVGTTLEGQILTWNPGAERLYGYGRDEVLGKHVSLLHGRKELESELMEKLARGERVSQLEALKLTKDGREIDVSLTISPILDRQGRIIGASRIARDITDRKALDRMKDDFVETVSHELRTPLTAIKGFLELVLDGESGPVSDTQREFLEVAARNTDRLGAIINDILDVSRLESQMMEIKAEPTDLTPVLEDVADTFRVTAESKGLFLHYQVMAGLPKVVGDASRLVQVFSNLVSNAIKYTPRGEVGMKAGVVGDNVEVIVHDSGIGLAPEELGQLFIKFFRGRNPVVTDSGGSGLGLVIAKAIVEKHRGTIEVESQPGVGTRFRVVLPRAAEPGAAPTA